MKAAFVFAAAAAVLASAPAQAVEPTVCQPRKGDPGLADAAPEFAVVSVTGLAAGVDAATHVTTADLDAASADNCVRVAGVDFDPDAVIRINWKKSKLGFADHETTCNLAITTICTFPANELKPVQQTAPIP
ncbi:MAG: hypothetical protein BJ554DRAFT_5761 [Olpidium bornovanus]|uniref:Uncharacterized protein n=1 Tax=Olpidium bornovanus TaxID=278681 RepID=A0A8H8A2B6_9FUNG|nr:MAG: hypothetical protein BJ554DRAFT_5761 [Olpidium bornovanus]